MCKPLGGTGEGLQLQLSRFEVAKQTHANLVDVVLATCARGSYLLLQLSQEAVPSIDDLADLLYSQKTMRKCWDDSGTQAGVYFWHNETTGMKLGCHRDCTKSGA